MSVHGSFAPVGRFFICRGDFFYMPAVVKKVKKGYKCFSHKGKGGRPLSKNVKSKKSARKQCQAVNISMHRSKS